MKASKIVNGLQTLIKKHGDLEIGIFSDHSEQSEPIGGIAVATEDQDEPVVSFDICGINTQDAFLDNAEQENRG